MIKQPRGGYVQTSFFDVVERKDKFILSENENIHPSLPNYLFTVKGGSDPIYPDTVNRYFSRFSKEYGIEDFHPHKLRHTAISIMLENGIPVVDVAAIAGHEDASVTHKVYAHASTDGMRAAIDTLANATKIG